MPVLVIAGSQNVAVAQERFPDTPEHHWVFETLTSFSNSLVPDIPAELIRGTQTRRDIALAILLVHDRLSNISDRLYTPCGMSGRRNIQLIREEVLRLHDHRTDITNLIRLVEVFSREITSMGKDPNVMRTNLWAIMTKNAEMRMRIAEAGDLSLPQFPDVPENHWVYDAVYAGRNNEFFFGYPSEWFRGSSTLTRYELAGVVNSFFQDVRGQVIRLQDQIDYIKTTGSGR